ncbi:MAG: hypothetical protein HFJ25_04355 [Clostridia bacterium]|jgi:hypothetical protein|nr:hypothetical protein [Clostridia bacterium]
MKSETRVAYAEIEEILRYMPKIYVDKIPTKLKDFFYQERDKKHSFKYDSSKKLANQNISKKTRTLLAILKLNYWCNSEDEKSRWKDKFIKNEENHQNYLREKYDPDNLFNKDMNDIKDKAQNMDLIEYRPKGILVKILDKIKKFFKIN